MKNLFRFLILIISINLSAQSSKAILLNPNVYRTKVDIPAIRVTDVAFNKIYNDKYLIKVSDLNHLDYKVIKEDENGFVIIQVLPKVKLLREKDSSTVEPNDSINVVRHTKSKQLKNDSDNAYSYYFAVKKDEFKPLSKTLLATKIVGVPIIQPLKLRPGHRQVGWDLNGEFTVSYNFGIRLKLNKSSFSQNFISFVPFGFGVGAAKYFKENIDGTLTEKKDATAITYYQGGIILTLEKVNIGFFTGLDAMIDDKNDWFYQSKPWFSFGLGYKFKND